MLSLSGPLTCCIQLTIYSQQYHVALIFLHGPFAEQVNERPQGSKQSHLESCLDNGISIARIFMHSHRRFDLRRSFITAMQHAGVAASALITSLAIVKDPQRRYNAMSHLLFLSRILQELAETYYFAIRMHKVVDKVLQQTEWKIEYESLRQEFAGDQKSERHIPVRRDSSSIENGPTSLTTIKRRRVRQIQSADGDHQDQGPIITRTSDSCTLDDNLDIFLQNVHTPGVQFSEATPSRSAQDGFVSVQGSGANEMEAEEQSKDQYPFIDDFDSSLVDWEQFSTWPENIGTGEIAFPSIGLK